MKKIMINKCIGSAILTILSHSIYLILSVYSVVDCLDQWAGSELRVCGWRAEEDGGIGNAVEAAQGVQVLGAGMRPLLPWQEHHQALGHLRAGLRELDRRKWQNRNKAPLLIFDFVLRGEVSWSTEVRSYLPEEALWAGNPRRWPSDQVAQKEEEAGPRLPALRQRSPEGLPRDHHQFHWMARVSTDYGFEALLPTRRLTSVGIPIPAEPSCLSSNY